MNILHTESSCGWGGQEIRILEESKGLTSYGHNVTVICPPESRVFEESAIQGVSTIALPIGRKNLKGLVSLYYWLKNNHVDIINTHSSTDTWLIAVSCQILKKPPPIIRTRHISSRIPNNRASHWLYARAMHHVVTTGESLRRQVIEQTGTNPLHVTSIPTGIDPERFRPGDKHQACIKLGLDLNSKYIGIVATLRSWKGHLYLLDAFAKLNNPEWKLLIVGDGPYRSVLDARTAELGIIDSVIYTGHQSNPEDWLRAIDIFCLPSYANEGVPQAIIQSMFSFIPIITTTAGAITEAIIDEETGLIIKPQDSDVLKEALNRLITNQSFGKDLSQRAYRYAQQHFTLKHMLDQMQYIFENTTASLS